MAAPVNGRAKKPRKAPSNGTLSAQLNGYANGHANGHANGFANGHTDKTKTPSSPAVRSSSRTKSSRTMTGAFTSIAARLTTWYIIVTILFRCPPSLTHINDDSPRVCKPYLQLRSHAAPYVDPYYQSYVAPHVEKLKPYTDHFDKAVYSPVATFTKDKYATYGAHRVDQARQYAEAQYDKSVRPQVQLAQDKVKTQYDLYLGPHVAKASNAAAPYYDQTKASLEEMYHLSVLPAYEASLPYLQKAHTHGHHFLVDIVFPNVQAARDTTWAFIIRTVWPQLRILYGDNVEPQLVRISERLGRYRDQQKVEAVIESLDSQTPAATEETKIVPTVASSSESAASPSSTTKGGWGVFDDFFGGDSSSTTATEVKSQATAVEPAEPKLSGAELKEKLNEDLRKWQSKFAVAADKGAEDLEQRVAEITKRQVENAVKGHGRALVTQLEETSDSTVASLKKYIKKTVKSIPEDATEKDLNAAFEGCGNKTRELGLAVKDKAQDVRAWKAAYDQETDSLVQAAVRSTVEVLEKIHGLGLQEVGMRWAWTDGVTYKDWQNYHKLRSTLNEWQAEVEAVGSRHEGLRIAHEEGKKLEDEAMTIASNMVAELVRLKGVSKWKIWAEDATDDFSDKKVPARVFKAAQQVQESVQDAVSQASEAIQGSSTPVTESVASVVQEKVSEVSSQASEAVQGSSTPLGESIAASAQDVVYKASSQASSAVLGTPSSEDVLSKASQAVEEAAAKAFEMAEDGAAKASDVYEQPKKVFGGANAQILAEAKQVIFDEPLDDDEDDETISEKIQDLAADASERAAELSRAVSEALLGPAKTQGSVESVTSLASGQYAQALAAASSVLYGTKQPAVESATSVAAEKFAQAVTAASYAIYGTPKPTAIIQTIQVQASSRYNDAVRVANEQLENAKSQLSLLVSGTPKPAHETMLSYFEKAYSDSVAVASERLQAALQYTESVRSYAAGPTQGYFESVSSIASSRLAEGLSQASAQFAQPTGVTDSARQQYYLAIGLAHERYSEFVNAASTAVYGPKQGTVESLASVASASVASAASVVSDTAGSAASNAQSAAQSAASNAQAAAELLVSQVSSGVIGSETPWTESVASQASQNWESLIAQASNQVYGKPTPWAESIYSQAGEYGAQATAAVAEQYAGVQALISELVIGKEPDFTESVMNRFSSAYHSGIPAAASSVSSFASEQLEAASSVAGESYDAVTHAAADAYASASSVIGSVFTPPPKVEEILSQASASLDLAIESASIAIYGTPKGAAEQASESVASAYSSIQSQISVQVYGTQQALDSFSAAALSAQAAISEAIYGTPTAAEYIATATNAAGEAYSSVASAASENAAYASSIISSAIYGPEQGAVESANSRIAAAVEAANSKIALMYAAASKGAEGAASTVVSAATEATQRVKDEL